MTILISGASGLVGRALVPALEAGGHRVIKLTRDKGGGAVSTWNPDAGEIDLNRVGPLDAVVHLAGETIAQRWTPSVKRRIRDSRVNGTRLLAGALAALPAPPKILVCASAAGIYGDRGDEVLDERSSLGTGFLAGVCRDWEAAARVAAGQGMRVVHLRLGIVLTPDGGALAKMLPAFRCGLGGRLGDGRACWSWIALGDVVSAIQFVLGDQAMLGPVNAVSPLPVTNSEFARTLGRVLGRPVIFPVPRFALNLLFGEMAREAMLASCRAQPARLLESGFVFRHPKLEPALRCLLAIPN